MGQSMSFSLTNLPTSPFTSLLSINPNVKSIEFKDAVCLLEIEYKTNHLFIEHFRRPVVIKIDESTPCGMQDSDTGSLEKTARLKLAFEIAPWFIDAENIMMFDVDEAVLSGGMMHRYSSHSEVKSFSVKQRGCDCYTESIRHLMPYIFLPF